MMKKIFILTLALIGFWACKKDASYSEYIVTSNEVLHINNRGFLSNGEIPFVDITSNIYWTASAENSSDWVDFSPKAGYGQTTMRLGVLPNSSTESRTMSFVARSASGAFSRITIVQDGTLEPIPYLKDSFDGEIVKENTPISSFAAWKKSGISLIGVTYGGSGAFVSSANPSKDYEGASGGNNILLAQSGSYFKISNFSTKGGSNFQLSLGYQPSISSGGGAMKIEISKNGTDWFGLDINSIVAQDSWSGASSLFSIDGQSIDRLYIRISSNVENLRIDDISIVESSIAGQKVTFAAPIVVPDLEGFPVQWSMPADGTTTGNASTTGYWCKSDDGLALIEAFRAITPAANANMSYSVTAADGGRLLMYGMFKDDYWKITIPVKNFKSGTKVAIATRMQSSASSARDFIIEYSDNDNNYSPVLADGSDYTFQLPNATQMEINSEFTLNRDIADGKLYIRFRVASDTRTDGKTPLSAAGTNRITRASDIDTPPILRISAIEL